MPIYEYRCTKCHKTFEKFQKITDDPLSKCPDCGDRVERLISQTSFSLKGGGWYKNGYTTPAPSKEKKEGEKKEDKKEKQKESKKKEIGHGEI